MNDNKNKWLSDDWRTPEEDRLPAEETDWRNADTPSPLWAWVLVALGLGIPLCAAISGLVMG